MRGKRRKGFEHHPDLQIESFDIAPEESACGGKAAGWQMKSPEKTGGFALPADLL
jgi:hypothetical protein